MDRRHHLKACKPLKILERAKGIMRYHNSSAPRFSVDEKASIPFAYVIDVRV